jgi:hypothetical protein
VQENPSKEAATFYIFFFFLKMIRVLSPHSILVDEMSMPGTDKGDECPGYIF